MSDCPGKTCTHRHDGPDPTVYTGPPCAGCYTCHAPHARPTRPAAD